ncbi:MAG: histidinol-phosphate transaminase [Bacteroidota bacterium]
MNIDNLVRPNIRMLKPYRSARQDHSSGVLLDANENSIGSVISEDGLNRYPDPNQTALRKGLANLNRVAVDNVFVGVGSDEVIDLLVRVFCEPNQDSVVVLDPTYGMYRVAASIQGVDVRSCLLTDEFQIDIEKTLAAVDQTTKLVFCCTPNNPTANLLRPDDILRLAQRLNSLVVVDEAYLDFAQSPSAAGFLNRTQNIVVLRTLSKAWGLAGIRLGYCIGNPQVVSYLMKVKPPYNINTLTSNTALRALGNIDRMRANVNEILRERERLVSSFTSLRFIEKVFPSDANFVLVRCSNARQIYDGLERQGVVVRDRSSEPKLGGCLRITVGTRAENDTLLRALHALENEIP